MTKRTFRTSDGTMVEGASCALRDLAETRLRRWPAAEAFALGRGAACMAAGGELVSGSSSFFAEAIASWTEAH